MSKTVTLGQFCEYVAAQAQEIRGVYAEIEEVQREFNGIYQRKLQAWQAAMNKAVPLLTGAADLPPALAQSLLKAVQEERARLQEEIAGLTAQVAARRQEGDAAIAEAQAELGALRQMNPELDAEEEAIKARMGEIRGRIRELDSSIKATPWLTGVLKRRRLRQARAAQVHSMAAETAALRQVRVRWQQEKQRCEASQAELRARWQTASTEAAQLQVRLDYLQGNLERLSREGGAANHLAALEAVPEAPEPLRGALAHVVELNRVKAQYEGGLRSVAEALGLLKGVAEGIDRFYRSAEKVYDEQRQYNLRELHLELADEVLAFHSLWPQLRAQLKDEKTLGAQPVEFSRRVQAAMQGRLGDSAIAAMFESMGDALTRATKAWG